MSINFSMSTSAGPPVASRNVAKASTAFSRSTTSGTSAADRALSYSTEALRLTLSAVMECPCLVEWVKPRPMPLVPDSVE